MLELPAAGATLDPPGQGAHTRTLSGKKGTIAIAGDAMGPWRIIWGTRAYAHGVVEVWPLEATRS